jgi:PilZ domain-containing protein
VGQQQSVKGSGTRRAQRFPIRMRLRFRPVGATDWHIGMVENISISGLLFRAETTMAVHMKLEMEFELPVELPGLPGAQVVSRGEVVRTVMPVSSDEWPATAARILDYSLVPGTEPPVA